MPSFIFTKMIVADLERETAFFEQVIGLKTVMRMVVGEGDAAADEVILSADGKPGGVRFPRGVGSIPYRAVARPAMLS